MKKLVSVLVILLLVLGAAGCASPGTSPKAADPGKMEIAPLGTGDWDITTPFFGVTLGMPSGGVKELLGEPDEKYPNSADTVMKYGGRELFGRQGTAYLKFNSGGVLISCRWESDMFYYDKDPNEKNQAIDFSSGMRKAMKQKAGDPDVTQEPSKNLYKSIWQMDGYYVELTLLLASKEYMAAIEYIEGEIEAE